MLLGAGSAQASGFPSAWFYDYLNVEEVDATPILEQLLSESHWAINLPCGPIRLANINIPRNVKLQSGCRVGKTIIKVPRHGLSNYNVFHSNTFSSIEINGVIFDGSWAGGKTLGGEPILSFQGLKSITLKNNEFKNLAIYQEGVPTNLWDRNNMLVKIFDTKTVIIEGNSVHNLYNYEVFNIQSRDATTVAVFNGNSFYDLGSANSPLNAVNLQQIEIANNIFREIKSSALNVFSRNATITGNDFQDLQTAAIDMFEQMFLSDNAQITNNTIKRCGLRDSGAGAGIRISGSNTLVSGNEISHCDSGLMVSNQLATDIAVYGTPFDSIEPHTLTGIIIENNKIYENRAVNLRIDSDANYPISASIRSNIVGNSLQTTAWNIHLKRVGTVDVSSNYLWGTGTASLQMDGSFDTITLYNNTFMAATGSSGNFINLVGTTANPTIGRILRVQENKFKANLSATSYDMFANYHTQITEEFSGYGNIGAEVRNRIFTTLPDYSGP